MSTAIRIHQFGGPDVLREDDVPVPEPGPGEVLVRVHAAGVNPVDCKIRAGGFAPVGEDSLPYTMGREISGVVEAVGEGVVSYDRGAAVHAMLGGGGRGGYAQHVIVKPAEASAVPQNLTHAQAAAVPLAALTAWQGLIDHGGLHSGQRVLIHGAGGGVGHFAVQIAHARGAKVVACVRGQDADLMRRMGVEQVIDTDAERFEDVCGEVDLVLDLLGGDMQDRSWPVLRMGGALVSTVQEPDPAKAARRDARAVIFMVEPNGTQLEEIDRLILKGEVQPVVAETMPLSQAPEAQRRLEERHTQGKIVLEVP